MSDEEIITKHDNLAGHTQPGVNHYLQEMYRRDQDRQTRQVLLYTRWITWMTMIITALTIVNVLAVVKSVFP